MVSDEKYVRGVLDFDHKLGMNVSWEVNMTRLNFKAILRG